MRSMMADGWIFSATLAIHIPDILQASSNIIHPEDLLYCTVIPWSDLNLNAAGFEPMTLLRPWKEWNHEIFIPQFGVLAVLLRSIWKKRLISSYFVFSYSFQFRETTQNICSSYFRIFSVLRNERNSVKQWSVSYSFVFSKTLKNTKLSTLNTTHCSWF